MKINIKQFCLGMLLGAIPALTIVANSLPQSNRLVLAETEMKEQYLRTAALPTLEPTQAPQPTSTPEPTSELKLAAAISTPIATQKPLTEAVVAVAVASVDNTPAPVNEASVLIDRYATEYGVDAELMKRIAQCESGFRAEAVNGPYAGIYQFLASTWASNRQAMGLDGDPALRYNLEEAIKTAAFKMSRDGYGAWPVCSRT